MSITEKEAWPETLFTQLSAEMCTSAHRDHLCRQFVFITRSNFGALFYNPPFKHGLKNVSLCAGYKARGSFRVYL